MLLLYCGYMMALHIEEHLVKIQVTGATNGTHIAHVGVGVGYFMSCCLQWCVFNFVYLLHL